MCSGHDPTIRLYCWCYAFQLPWPFHIFSPLLKTSTPPPLAFILIWWLSILVHRINATKKTFPPSSKSTFIHWYTSVPTDPASLLATGWTIYPQLIVPLGPWSSSALSYSRKCLWQFPPHPPACLIITFPLSTKSPHPHTYMPIPSLPKMPFPSLSGGLDI